MQNSYAINGKIVDVLNNQIFPGTIHIADGRITQIETKSFDSDVSLPFIMPGFVDSHVHIESSMLIPSEFARLAVVHGTVGTVSDPHEIANVCGMEGVRYMIDNGKTVPFKFNFGAPSCVPATVFETAGATLTPAEVEQLLMMDEIRYLSEMMNFPGVLNNDPDVMQKIKSAHRLGKPVDGHAPGVRGEAAARYINAGISTDHECFTAEEALDKLQRGMKILIREGSAAKNFDALIDLLSDHSDSMMFCSDDKHPDSLADGHINALAVRAVKRGIDVFKVVRAACINPVLHYKLDIGLLRKDDPADFILVRDLENFEVLATFIDGAQVADAGIPLIRRNDRALSARVNNFNCSNINAGDLAIKDENENYENFCRNIIGALDGQLITEKLTGTLMRSNGQVVSNPEQDLLKIVVVNRYNAAVPSKAFIKNFGIREGALASSVAHDSHNIVAVGSSDELLVKAINEVIGVKGGISCVSDTETKLIPLSVGGLMTDEDGYEVARAYTDIDRMARSLGSQLQSPFMTLSFMALLVIPHLKLSDLGLFDGDKFSIIS
ncbi:MAG: adenine deaminase [Chitinophagaceae bacterium]|nr:MAG: adenine deaminase [Chitinophagaceae bacterium]